MTEQLAIQDMWQGSFLLTEANAKLVDVQASQNGRTTVIFTFRGDKLSEMSRAYCNGEAQANVTRLRENINLLRDFIFQARQKR